MPLVVPQLLECSCALQGSIAVGMLSLPFRRKLNVIAGICLTENFRIWPKLPYRLCTGKLLPLSLKSSHLLGTELAVQLPSGIPCHHLGQVAWE